MATHLLGLGVLLWLGYNGAQPGETDVLAHYAR